MIAILPHCIQKSSQFDLSCKTHVYRVLFLVLVSISAERVLQRANQLSGK